MGTHVKTGDKNADAVMRLVLARLERLVPLNQREDVRRGVQSQWLSLTYLADQTGLTVDQARLALAWLHAYQFLHVDFGPPRGDGSPPHGAQAWLLQRPEAA